MDSTGRGDTLAADARHLDTVRALHQTVVALRVALDKSRAELDALRLKVQADVAYTDTIQRLSLENHVLRRRFLDEGNAPTAHPPNQNPDPLELPKRQMESSSQGKEEEASASESAGKKPSGDAASPEREVVAPQEDAIKPQHDSKVFQQNVVVSQQEVAPPQEDVTVSKQEVTLSHGGTAEGGERKLSEAGDGVEGKRDEEGGESDNESEELDDIELIFTTEETKELGVLQEALVPITEGDEAPSAWTDISKVGVAGGRRNTLAAPLTCGQSPARPILADRAAARRESGAQTDITAVPAQWRSEGYLARKVAVQRFATLPSKFALPAIATARYYAPPPPRPADEARRALLSDIDFTSMVPELSRSADHLCRGFPVARACTFSSRSPSCDCSHGDSLPGPRYRGSLASLDYPDPAPGRYTWRPPPRRPTWGSVPSSPTHSRRPRPFRAAPSDAELYAPGYWSADCDGSASWGGTHSSKAGIRNRVTFFDTPLQRRSGPGRSLPDLRPDVGAESGDSTDSLIDEAEEYLRRSIDSTLTRTDWARVGKKRQARRMSDPDPVRELTPPKSARPFLPKTARELRLDYLVKVITADGRVAVGRVRYVGPPPGNAGREPLVGVELPDTTGNCDGTFAGRRYFDCDADKAVFVPFKKVVMAWSI